MSPDTIDSDDEPAFMPVLHQDPSATLRGDPRNIARKTGHANANKRQVDLSQTSDSSASSTPASAAPRRDVHVRGDRPVGPLSPRRTAELAGTGRGSGKGSDGTPSMGSSFSDLDGMFSLRGSVNKTDENRCFGDTVCLGRSTC